MNFGKTYQSFSKPLSVPSVQKESLDLREFIKKLENSGPLVG